MIKYAGIIFKAFFFIPGSNCLKYIWNPVSCALALDFPSDLNKMVTVNEELLVRSTGSGRCVPQYGPHSVGDISEPPSNI